MKRMVILVLVFVLVSTIAVMVSAREKDSVMDPQTRRDKNMMDKDRGMMMGHDDGKMGMMKPGGKPMCPMCGMACESMMKRDIVPTEDGGVIVVCGDQIIKYDANLNLVKQTEIKIDMEQMQQKMMKMMQSCPMCKKMKMMHDDEDEGDEMNDN